MEIRYTLKKELQAYYIHERDVPETYYIISGPFDTEEEAWDYIQRDLNAMGDMLATDNRG